MSVSTTQRNLAKKILAMALAFVLCATMVPAQPAFASPTNGWETVSGQKHYYRSGEKVVGKQKIGNNYYFFNAGGTMKTGTVKDGSTTYYLNDKGQMEAYKVKNTFYKPTDKKMASWEAKEYQTLLNARKWLAKITKKSDSKATKLRKCFKWVQKGYYYEYRQFHNRKGIWADFANDHFTRKHKGYRMGDCNSDSAAFAYLALAIGYGNVHIGIDTKAGKNYGHGTASIGKKFYDPLLHEAYHGASKYYGGKSGGYHFRWAHIMVPSASNGFTTSTWHGEKLTSASAKSTSKKSTAKNSKKNGLRKEGGSYVYYQKGKLLKKKWKAAGGARYYFDAKGRALTGPAKVGSKRYVFSAKGKLLTGKKTRTVKVSGETYRVTRAGVASPGWDRAKRHLYLANGRMARGVSAYKGGLYLFSASGAYDAAGTSKLRAAAREGADASALLALVGKPERQTASPSCNPAYIMNGNGDDVTYYYKNATLNFFRYADGRMFFVDFE